MSIPRPRKSSQVCCWLSWLFVGFASVLNMGSLGSCRIREQWCGGSAVPLEFWETHIDAETRALP